MEFSKTAIVDSGDRLDFSAPKQELALWDDYAEEYGMKRSEFVRAAVSAAISELDIPSYGEQYGEGSNTYRHQIITAVSDGASTREEILNAVLEDAEDRIKDDISALLQSGQIQMDGHEGFIVSDNTAIEEEEEGD